MNRNVLFSIGFLLLGVFYVPEPVKAYTITRSVSFEVPADVVYVTNAVFPYLVDKGFSEVERGISSFDKKVMRVSDGRLFLDVDQRPVIVEVVDTPVDRNDAGLSDKMSSPYGIYTSSNSYPEDMKPLGVNYARLSGVYGAIWGFLEPQKGVYDFSSLDRRINSFYSNGAYPLVTINSVNLWDRGMGDAALVDTGKLGQKLPNNIAAYAEFIRRLVERYDGDGVDDAPGSPVVLYWQLHDKIDVNWEDSSENFAELMKITSRAMKEANPQAKLVIGGIGLPYAHKSQKIYSDVIKRLGEMKKQEGKSYIDVFDLHAFSLASDYTFFLLSRDRKSQHLEETLKMFRFILDYNGFKTVPIFMTEVSVHSSCPRRVGNRLVICQREDEQASTLFKMYIYSLSNGVSKVFWFSLVDFFNFGGVFNGVYDNAGLIRSRAYTKPYEKKYSYYTLMLLASKTKDVDWSTLTKIDVDASMVSVYRVFRKRGDPVYFVWAD